MSRQYLAESALQRILVDSGKTEPQLDDLLGDPEFRKAFPSLFAALADEKDYLDRQVYNPSPAQPPTTSSVSAAKRILREATALPSQPVFQVSAVAPAALPPKKPVAAAPAPPPMPGMPSVRQRLIAEGLSAEGVANPAESAELVLDFVQIAFSSIKHRQDVFADELAKQICLVLPGINPARVKSELSKEEDFVRVKVWLPTDRAEQLAALYEDKPNLLKHAPLLQSAVLVGKSTGQVAAGLSTPDSAALLKRLDNLVRQYSDTRSKRDTLTLFHRTMAMTDDMKKKAKHVAVVGNPQINSNLNLNGPLPFPYRGVPNVLSPRGMSVNHGDTRDQPGAPQMMDNYEGGTCRPVPPQADVVENKRTMDATLAHFSGSAVRLTVENKELSRSFKEASEVAEARRLVQAGLVNPSTLDLLLKTNEARHEQDRRMDELRMQTSEEEDRRRAIELESSNEYLKRLFAVATGELDDTQAHSVPRPSEVRKLQDTIRGETVELKRSTASVRRDRQSRREFSFRVDSASDVPATNLLGGFTDSYVRIRVVEAASGKIKAEAQTRTTSGSATPEWQETINFEVDEKNEALSVFVAVMGYNPIGADSPLAETLVDYELFKKSRGSSCWFLPCVVLEEHKNISLFLTVTVDDNEEVTTIGLSQAAARQRYWRHQAALDAVPEIL